MFNFRFLYYATTTLSDYQTLGEEYSGIVMVDNSKERLPGRLRRLLLVASFCYGPLGMERLLKKAEKAVESSDTVRKEAKETLLQSLSVLRRVLDAIQKLNGALFYLGAAFYTVSHRVAGIRYLATTKENKNASVENTFKTLGLISLVNLTSVALFQCYRLYQTKKSESKGTSKEHKPVISLKHRCMLCLENCRDISYTPCGHLFCWGCIHEALARDGEQQGCPACREPIKPQRVVRLMNYG